MREQRIWNDYEEVRDINHNVSLNKVPLIVKPDPVLYSAVYSS